MRTGSELNRFGVWKKAGEKYLSQINAKRFRCLLGSEILLYEGDNLNAIVAFTGPGKSRKPLYSLFEYGGRFSETCFLSNAVLYDKSGKPQLSTAFYFDESLTSEEAKRLIADFLSAIRI